MIHRKPNIPHLVNDEQKTNIKSKIKMFPNNSTFAIVVLICVLFIQVQTTDSSVIEVQDGVYKRLTVKLSEAVPRQLCHRAINNLQVGLSIYD